MRSEERRKLGVEGNLTYAATELERMQKLYASGDVSKRDLDTAQERYDDLKTSTETLIHSISMIESSLDGAKADITRAQEGLNNTVIAAPMDGVIVTGDLSQERLAERLTANSFADSCRRL